MKQHSMNAQTNYHPKLLQILEESTQPEENISGPPTSVAGIPISHREVHVKWEPPIVTNGIISKYRIYYFEVGDDCDVIDENLILNVSSHRISLCCSESRLRMGLRCTWIARHSRQL